MVTRAFLRDTLRLLIDWLRSHPTSKAHSTIICKSLFKNGWRWYRFAPSQSIAYSFSRKGFALRRIGATYAQPSSTSRDLVTIITRTIPTRRLFLKDAMVSALNQTHSNIQWIITQDGGKPINSAEIGIPNVLRPMVTIVTHQKSGRASTGNRGLCEANGLWIKWLDDDDWLYADDIETLLNADTDADLRYGFAWTIPTEKTDEIVKKESSPFVNFDLYPQTCTAFDLSEQNRFPIQAPLFRKRQDVLIPEKLESLEDWAFWRAYMASGGHGVRVCKTLSGYRIPASHELFVKRQIELDIAYKDFVQNY